MIRSLAFNLYFYVGTLIAAILGILLVPIPTPVLLRGLLHYWARAVVWGMRWIGGMKVEVLVCSLPWFWRSPTRFTTSTTVTTGS